ncbi:MAG: LysR family transcriptional regulator [Rhizobiaceae bacterium]
MDRFEAMRVLLAVVDTGGFSAAARRIGSPLATVSRRVADLESHLGIRLLNRTSRRIELTDAGRDYVEAARRILSEVGEAERAVAGEYASPRGLLTVTAPLVFGRLHVVPVIVEFLKAYPDVSVNLTLNDRIVSFDEDHIDAAIRIGVLPPSSLVAVRLGEVRRIVCASPDYLVARGEPKRPADLQGHGCIAFEGMVMADGWRFGDGKSGASVPIRSRLSVNTAEAAIDAAIAGLGVTRVLSYQVATPLRDGRLRTVLDEYAPPPLPVHLVRATGRMPPHKVRALFDFAAPRLRASLGALAR